MKHYVYRLEDPITNEFYIGSRSCKCDIKDDPYMGSYYTWKPEDKSILVKTILKSNFRKRETCIKYEAKIIKENIDTKLNRNYHIPKAGFHTMGKSCSDETRKKLSNIILNNLEEHRARVKKYHADVRGEMNPFYGKHHTDKTKLNHSKFMKSQPSIKCPYCDKVGGNGIMQRWHFDNCKLKNKND